MRKEKENHQDGRETEQTTLFGNCLRWQSCPPTDGEPSTPQHDSQPEDSEGAIQFESNQRMSDREFNQFVRFNKDILPQLAQTVGVQLNPVFVPDKKEWHLAVEDVSRLEEQLSEQKTQLDDFK